MTPKKITPDSVKEMIAETAKYMKSKQEIADQALKLEESLKTLNEMYAGAVSSFGFTSPGDISNKTKNGFANPMNPFSNLSDLGAEITAELNKTEETETIDEVAVLKKEIETLKEELAKLKK